MSGRKGFELLMEFENIYLNELSYAHVGLNCLCFATYMVCNMSPRVM